MKRFIVIFAAAALALGVVNPASANFIYDLTGISGHQQFETASVLTSSTLITSFTINTSPTYTVLALGPGPGDSCTYAPAGLFNPGPCVGLAFAAAGGNGFSATGMPTFEATGTFTSFFFGQVVTLTITSAAAVPEPATLALIGLGLAAGLAFTRRRKSK